MDQSTHNRYFRDIATNQDANTHWEDDSILTTAITITTKPIYEQRIEQLIHHCIHITSTSELFDTYQGNNNNNNHYHHYHLNYCV
jgi:hypothetical protein